MEKCIMAAGANESEFYMWRTLFSVAHADNVVTDEEISFMAAALDDVDFSEEQITILKDDTVNAKDHSLMFEGITNQDDRLEFFSLARDLVWVDGEFASEEQSVMIELYKQNIKDTTFEELIGHTSLELEGDSKKGKARVLGEPDNSSKVGILSIFSNFKKRFTSKL